MWRSIVKERGWNALIELEYEVSKFAVARWMGGWGWN
jgi:hypothetical protein